MVFPPLYNPVFVDENALKRHPLLLLFQVACSPEVGVAEKGESPLKKYIHVVILHPLPFTCVLPFALYTNNNSLPGG